MRPTGEALNACGTSSMELGRRVTQALGAAQERSAGGVVQGRTAGAQVMRAQAGRKAKALGAVQERWAVVSCRSQRRVGAQGRQSARPRPCTYGAREGVYEVCVQKALPRRQGVVTGVDTPGNG